LRREWNEFVNSVGKIVNPSVEEAQQVVETKPRKSKAKD
jgi:hypothetical protein